MHFIIIINNPLEIRNSTPGIFPRKFLKYGSLFIYIALSASFEGYSVICWWPDVGLRNIIADWISAYGINSMVNDLLIYRRLRFSSDADKTMYALQMFVLLYYYYWGWVWQFISYVQCSSRRGHFHVWTEFVHSSDRLIPEHLHRLLLISIEGPELLSRSNLVHGRRNRGV